MNKKEKIIIFARIFLMLGILVFTQVGCDGSSQSSNEAPLVSAAVPTTEKKPSPLPDSPEEAKAIAEAADIDNVIGQDRWDREIQEAANELNNPFNRGGRRGENNNLPGGMPNPNPQGNNPALENPEDDNEDAAVANEAENQNQANERRARACRNATGTVWNENTHQCRCDSVRGYMKVGNVCKQRIRSIAVDVKIAGDGRSGTDANLRVRICPKSNPQACKAVVFSAGGRYFEIDTENTFYIELDSNTQIPIDGLSSVSITNADDAGDGPEWFLKAIRVSALPATDNRVAAFNRISYLALEDFENVAQIRTQSGDWQIVYYNPCVYEYINDNVDGVFSANACFPAVMRLLRTCTESSRHSVGANPLGSLACHAE